MGYNLVELLSLGLATVVAQLNTLLAQLLQVLFSLVTHSQVTWDGRKESSEGTLNANLNLSGVNVSSHKHDNMYMVSPLVHIYVACPICVLHASKILPKTIASGFHWSYTLLLKPPVLICSYSYVTIYTCNEWAELNLKLNHTRTTIERLFLCHTGQREAWSQHTRERVVLMHPQCS